MENKHYDLAMRQLNEIRDEIKTFETAIGDLKEIESDLLETISTLLSEQTK